MENNKITHLGLKGLLKLFPNCILKHKFLHVCLNKQSKQTTAYLQRIGK